jgi:hypothetical protein
VISDIPLRVASLSTGESSSKLLYPSRLVTSSLCFDLYFSRLESVFFVSVGLQVYDYTMAEGIKKRKRLVPEQLHLFGSSSPSLQVVPNRFTGPVRSSSPRFVSFFSNLPGVGHTFMVSKS